MPFFGIVALAVGAIVALYLYEKGKNSSVIANSNAETLPSSGAAPAPGKSGIGNDYDALIAAIGGAEGVDPALMKAIIAKESYFNEEAVNPEKTFTLNGVTYAPADPQGQRALHDWIAAGGNEPESIGLNPSLGLAQVRVKEGKIFVPGIKALELFDPQTNLTAEARLLAQLFSEGVTLDTIDAYNVGPGRVLAGTLRNLPYQKAVSEYFTMFRGDFP